MCCSKTASGAMPTGELYMHLAVRVPPIVQLAKLAGQPLATVLVFSVLKFKNCIFLVVITMQVELCLWHTRPDISRLQGMI
jgi:hypothetical protein